MIELARVEMYVVDAIGTARPNHGYAEALREPRLVVNAPSSDRDRLVGGGKHAAGKVGDDKSRAADFSNDLVVDLVAVFLLVDPEGAIASGLNRRLKSIVECVRHALIEPHRDEGLRCPSGAALKGFHPLETLGGQLNRTGTVNQAIFLL